MASSNADGSLILDTELDNTGFEKGSEKLLSSIEKLSQQIDKIGAAMEKAFSNPETYLQAAGNAASQAAATAGDQAKAATQAAGAADAYSKELAKLQKQINSAEKELESYNKEIEEIQNKTDVMLPTALTDEQAAHIMEIEEQEIAKVNAKYAEKIATLEQLKGEYDRVSAAQKEAINSSNEANQANQASQSLGAYDKELAKLEKQIAKAKDALKSYYDALAEIQESTDAMLPQAATDEQARIVMEMEEQEIEKLNQKYKEKIAILEQLEAEYSRVSEARKNAAVSQGEEAQDGEEAVQKGIHLSGVTVMLTQALGRASEAAMSLGQRLARITFNAISAGVKKAVSSLKSFTSQAGKTSLTTNGLVRSLTSLKRMLITRIKRTFISSIFKDVNSGIQRLAQFDSEFNTHMNSIKNSATQLNGNIAVSLGNIIAVFEPFITKVINLLSTAIDYLNQFFALLQGKTSYTTAKMGADDYASSADKAAKAQKKWNNELYSFDELNRQNKKDDNDNKSGADGSGIQYETKDIDLPEGVKNWVERLKKAWKDGDWYGVGKVIADGLNTAMQYVDDWINTKFRPWGVKWADRIAQILNGLVDGVNWNLLGKTVADGLNAILDIANTFLKKFNFLNLGKGIGAAINSLVDNIDWHLLADTLANGFMGLVNLAYGFLSTFDGLKLGKNIGAAIKQWFDSIDWNLVGQTFALKWNALLHIIEGIVTTPGIWESIGHSIGQFVRGWFSSIDINSLATIMISILNGVTAMIRSFLDQNPFEGVAEKIYNAINRVIHEVNWAELGKAISDLFMEVLKVFRKVVDNVNWSDIGKAIGNFLGNIDWWGILSNVAAIIWQAFIGILDGLMSTKGGRMFLALFAAIKGLSLAFTLTEGLWKMAVQRWIMTGVSPLQSMPELINDIAPALKTALGGLAKVVKIGALAVFDAMMIAYDVKSLREASKTYNEAQNAHNRETQTALDTFSRLYKEKGPEVAAEWAKTVYGINTTGMSMDQAQSALTKKIDHYWDDVPQNMWQGFKQGWSSYFGTNGKGLLGLLGDSFTGAVNGVKSLLGIHSPSTVFEGIGKNMVFGLQNGFSSVWSRAGNAMLQAWSNIRTSFGNIQWNNIGHNMVAGLMNGVNGAWGTLTSTIVGYANNLISRIKGAFGIHSPSTVFAEIGEYLDAGLEKGIETGQKGLLRTATQVASAVTNGMTPDSPKVDVVADGVVGSMQAVISGLSEIATTFKTIADTLIAVGGFTMPQIAEGTVVPYRTRVDDRTPSEDDSGDLVDYLMNILAELRSLARTAAQNNRSGQNSDVRVVIDGHEVFQVIVDENNRAIRRMGSSPLRR